MKRMLTDYIENVEKKLNSSKQDKGLAEEILTEVTFFQHERLIHLIVTVFTGIITILFLLGFLYFENIPLLILFLLTLILFIPYIFHYYFLENGVQKLYDLYWKAKEK